MSSSKPAHTSFYRKYRPQLWDDVFGQDKIIQVLKNSLRRSSISHAYLFCGPRGTGKTSSARLFAAALNCDDLQESNPCMQCSSCKAFYAGNYPDFHELDAASNRKIDDFREIRDQVQYPPLQGKDKFKIFVIDEAHMLTKEAANAFLKTLEEPPSYVVFILATTEPQKLLTTIVSRCIRLDFQLLSHSSVLSRLKAVMEQEDIFAPEAVLDQIVSRGGGGMRDTLTLLEQAVQFCGHKIEQNEYLGMMGLASLTDVDHILEFYMNENRLELVRLYKDLIQTGKNPNELIFQLMQRVQEYVYFLLKIPGSYAPVPAFVGKEKVSYWVSTFGHLLDTLENMRRGLFPEYYGEFGLLSGPVEKGSGPSHPSAALQTAMDKIKELENRLGSLENGQVVPNADTQTGAAAKATVEFKDKTMDSFPHVERKWALIQKEIKQKNPLLMSVLREATPREQEGKFCLYFDTKHSFHYNKVQSDACIKLLTDAVVNQYGSGSSIELILGDPPEQEGESSQPIKKSVVKTEKQTSSSQNYVSEDLKEKLLRDQGLKRIVDELGAEIKNVD